MGFGSRLPTPNEPNDSWRYGPQEPHDDFSALLNGDAHKCRACKRVTLNKFLKDGLCPECDAVQRDD